MLAANTAQMGHTVICVINSYAGVDTYLLIKYLCTCEILLLRLVASSFFGTDLSLLERLKDGNIHMCFSSRSGYRPFTTHPPALGN